MKKYYIAVLAAVFVSLSANAQIKIGYMNPGQVLANLEEVAIIEQEIQKLAETRDADLSAKFSQLQQDLATYEEGVAVLSAEARAAKEQELLDRNDQLEQERETYLNEIQQKRLQMMSPILDKMDEAIKSIATEMELDLVLNETTSYGDAIIFYSSEGRLNITQRVIDILQAE